MIKGAELIIFVPSPGMGHFFSTVEFAKMMISRDERLSITVLTMQLPFDIMVGADSLSAASASPRLRFVTLPKEEDDGHSSSGHPDKSSAAASADFIYSFVEEQKSKVRTAVAELLATSDPPHLAGFVVDLFCTTMADVANEYGVPTYVFFTSNAGFLGMMLHVQKLRDELGIDVTELKDSETELEIPSYANPVPAKVLPSCITDKSGWSTVMLNLARRHRETKGILVNTFQELESHALESLRASNPSLPRVYPVGPIVNPINGSHSHKGREKRTSEIMAWLDEQPLSSVVFLCFGSMGSFAQEQVMEIANGVELSRARFLWSLRRSPPEGKPEFPKDYSNPPDVLPAGFLDRTAGTGLVIGWAPQVAVLAHQSVGGFVSHCGWNSILESLCHGVPLATWPIYAEQQVNAFALVKEFGSAVEITLDYRRDFETKASTVVTAESIAAGIKRVMVQDSDVRRRVRDMKEKSKKALMDGGSSYIALGHMIGDVIGN